MASYAVDDDAAGHLVRTGAGRHQHRRDVTWQTDEAANSRVDYGTAADQLTQSETSAAFVLSHSMPLTGLSPATTYYYTVTSTDPSGNPDSAVQSFSTARASWTETRRPTSPTARSRAPR